MSRSACQQVENPRQTMPNGMISCPRPKDLCVRFVPIRV